MRRRRSDTFTYSNSNGYTEADCHAQTNRCTQVASQSHTETLKGVLTNWSAKTNSRGSPRTSSLHPTLQRIKWTPSFGSQEFVFIRVLSMLLRSK